MNRHHIEPNMNISLTRNFSFDSEVRQLSHPLMISLHCLRAKSKNRTCGQFEYDLTWCCCCFFILFVHMHGEKKSKGKPDKGEES